MSRVCKTNNVEPSNANDLALTTYIMHIRYFLSTDAAVSMSIHEETSESRIFSAKQHCCMDTRVTKLETSPWSLSGHKKGESSNQNYIINLKLLMLPSNGC